MSISADDLQTRAPSVRSPSSDQTQATAAGVARQAGMLREEINVLQADVGETHRTSLRLALSERAGERGRQSPQILLEILARDKGFSWTSLARMMRVSIPAVRKWRNGEPISGENRRRLSILVAFIDLLEDHFGIADPASWMEMPLSEGVSTTAVDIYANGSYQALLEYAGGHRDAHALLDEALPTWRDDHEPGDYEIFEGPDGSPAFTRKES